jgi:hypothetical protein
LESRVGRRIFDGDRERGIVVVELARDLVVDGNHHDLEIYFVVEDYTVENRVYYLFFDLMTDFDFVVDTDDHLLVNDLSDRIEVQGFVYGICYPISTFVDLVVEKEKFVGFVKTH